MTVTSSVVSAASRCGGQRQDVRLVGEERGARLDDLTRRLVGRAAPATRERRDRRRESGDGEEAVSRVSPAQSATFVGIGRCAKRSAGSSMPRFSNFSRNIGRRPVGWSWPVIVRSGLNESILNSKMSWRVITSRLHALHLGDRGAAARAVLEPLEVDDQVERRRDLLADRPHGQLVAGHQHHRLDAGERVARRVGVHRGERAVVARVHRLEHVERLRAAALADDDPVGPHAQRVADEVADRDRALALDVLRARLEPEHVALLAAGARPRPRS